MLELARLFVVAMMLAVIATHATCSHRYIRHRRAVVTFDTR